MPVETPSRVVTVRGMFQDLSHEIRLRKAEGTPKRGTCFIEMRTLPRLNLTSRILDVPVKDKKDPSKQATWAKGTQRAGQLKFEGLPCPCLDFENLDEDGKPKPTIVHVTRCRASIFYDYAAKVQAAQVRNEQQPDFKAGPPAWEWRRFENDGDVMPFCWKVIRDKDGHEVETPVKDRKIYLAVLPAWVKRDANGVVLRENGKTVPFPENEDWYEDIKTGTRLTDAVVKLLKEGYLPEKDRESIAAAQGHFNVDDNVEPLMPNIQNVTYLAALGKRYMFPQRKFGPLSPTDFEMLELMVEDDDLTKEGYVPGYPQPIGKKTKK